MARHVPTVAEGQRSLKDHVLEKALEARAEFGPNIDWDAFLLMLKDTRFVRYPVNINFGLAGLKDGEFAWLQPRGEAPADGYQLNVHPTFTYRQDLLPLLCAYHLVVVNYGEIVSHEEAELFGAAMFGMEIEDYYQTLCRAADAAGA